MQPYGWNIICRSFNKTNLYFYLLMFNWIAMCSDLLVLMLLATHNIH